MGVEPIRLRIANGLIKLKPYLIGLSLASASAEAVLWYLGADPMLQIYCIVLFSWGAVGIRTPGLLTSRSLSWLQWNDLLFIAGLTMFTIVVTVVSGR